MNRAGVSRWRPADDPPEVVHEVGLIRIPESQGEIGPGGDVPILDARGRLFDAVQPDDPLGAHADVRAEDALEGSRTTSPARDSLRSCPGGVLRVPRASVREPAAVRP